MRKAFYDLSVSPYSYDFVQFLAVAKGLGCTHTVFVPGERAYQKCSPAEQKYRMQNLLLPLAKLAGDVTICNTRDEAREEGQATYPFGYTVDNPTHGHMLGQLLKAGRARWLKASKEANSTVREFLDGRVIATITIRESKIKPLRNSNIREWIKVGRWLMESGYYPVFIPDTDNQETDFGYDSYPLASRDVDVRLALYDHAQLNLGINNGPMSLCWGTKTPYLIFKMHGESYPETSEAFLKANGLHVGSQFPWAGKNQRIVWEDDTAENIIRAVEKTFLKEAA